MSKECFFTGKKARLGNQISRRGKAKYLGGVGKKTTGISRRKFRANLQSVRAVVNGRTVRIWVSTAAIRSGEVTKPIKRKAFKIEDRQLRSS